MTNDDPPGRLERLLSRLPEELFLRGLLVAMVVGTAAFLYLDVRMLMEQGSAEWVDPRRNDGPATVFDPSAPSDQLRPYLPRSAPVRRDRARPVLPGVPTDQDDSNLERRLAFYLGAEGRATAIGRIEPGAASEFERFLEANPGRVTTLVLHSPGGSVRDALELGRLIRKRGLATRVTDNGYCASSCPLAFAGGIDRVASEAAWIGVHQVYTTATAIGSLQDGLAEAQRISAVCQDYLVEMGVDPRVWTIAMRTSKRDLYVFTGEELRDLRLATKAMAAPPPVRKARPLPAQPRAGDAT
ncbi:MAG: hypothetical protein GC150_10325 [Rhizobiales bacterium]|nr:hypothetical protein [Hyphomicrobiales bacterium]